MTYVIAAPCIADYSCLEVCPAQCISPGPNDIRFQDAEQLYINPETCIDCGACIDVCPVEAIFRDDSLPPKWQHYRDINREYFADNLAPLPHAVGQ